MSPLTSDLRTHEIASREPSGKRHEPPASVNGQLAGRNKRVDASFEKQIVTVIEIGGLAKSQASPGQAAQLPIYQLVIYDVSLALTDHFWEFPMSSPKSRTALERLGGDLRRARLTRRVAVADLAVRAGTSPSTVARLEKGDPGVAVGTLADVLVALGLIERLADLVDIRKDELGLAMTSERLPQRGRSFSATVRKQERQNDKLQRKERDAVDPDGMAF
jgi:transcriptional regulator with XRE-family HTH domain